MVPEAIVGGYRYSSTNLEIREQSSFIPWDRVGRVGGFWFCHNKVSLSPHKALLHSSDPPPPVGS